ncbi:MAG: hypothetical protein AB8G05_15335 [Oligoflexales bacterium]
MPHPLSRRMAVRMIPFGLVIGTCTVLLQCLNNKKKKNDQTGEELEEGSGTPTFEQENPKEELKKEDSSNKQKDNTPNVFQTTKPNCIDGSNQIAIDKVQDAEEAFDPIIKLFGLESNAMIVIALPKYQHSNLKDIFLLTNTGTLLAHKGIGQLSDIDVDKTLKPVVFDNIFIGNHRRFALLYQTIDNLYSKHVLGKSIQFETNFNGKKVYGLTPVSVPTQDYFKSYINNIVEPIKEQFDYQQDQNIPIFAGLDTKFHPLTLDKNSLITDLIGTSLNTTNGEFKDFGRHNMFIHYKLVEDFYLRTIIKIV